MGEMITLTAEDGHKLAGYRAHENPRPVTVSAVMRAGVITSPAPSWRGPARWTS